MSVKFLNQNITVNTVRPTGFKFPVGLPVATSNTVVDYLVVAGGGASNYEIRGDAGGAGGFRTASGFSISSGTSYPVTVGGGGPVSPADIAGPKGSNSIWGTIISEGGGGGGRAGQSAPLSNGVAGGSGGGAGGLGNYNPAGLGGAANTSPVVQGSSGGNGTNFDNGNSGGGGGGAGDSGQNGQPSNGGTGGIGTINSFLTTALATSLGVGQVSGPAVYFSGGGGAGKDPSSVAAGGLGGGGGAPGNPSRNGMDNTGGGAGTLVNLATGANGGKGVVIIRYAGAVQLATGGTVSTPSGYVVHTFTGDGTFATNTNFGVTSYSIN